MSSSYSLQIEELLSGEISIVGRLVDASNATLFCELEIDSNTELEARPRVVYKPIAGERPLWDFPEGNLAGREVAAYLFSDFADFHLVPKTVMRDGPFGPGAVQEWIEADPEIDVIAFAQGNDPRLRMMALFDCLINNTDRKFGHILIDSAGSLFGCDHGVSFHSDFKLRTVLWQFAGMDFAEEERARLDFISENFQEISPLLSPYLSSAEIAELENRTHNLKSMGRFPYPNPSWPAVPWPPV